MGSLTFKETVQKQNIPENAKNTTAAKKAQNNALFLLETAFFGTCFVAFLIMNFFFNIPERTANILYIVFIVFSFGWLFSYEFLFKKQDNAVHFKMFAKNYTPVPNAKGKENYKRKGIGWVIALWITYLIVIFLFKLTGYLSWELFLAGAAFMFMLNSFFTRKVCLLSLLFLHNKNHCCKNCGINCWDYLIFASALIFAPRLSVAATVINCIIIVLSVVMMIMWEYNYKKYPFRFYPDTNMTLNCNNCLKQCHKKQ